MFGTPTIFRPSSALSYPVGRVPGFDPSHPMAKGVLCSPVVTGQAGAFNFAPGNTNQFLLTPNGSGIDASLGYYATWTAFNTAVAIMSTPTLTSFTGGVICKINTLNQTWLLEMLDAGSGLTLQQTGGGVLSINSTSTTVSTFATVLTAGAPYFIAVSSSSGKTSYLVILNLSTGKLITESVTAAAFSSTLSGSYRFGDNHSTGSLYLAASCANSQYVGLAQLLQWAKDPWGFWYPQKTDLAKILSMIVAGLYVPNNYWQQIGPALAQ